MNPLTTRLAQEHPILLDGATGTELNRRGVSTDLPLWSTRALLDAPRTLWEVHRDYVNAGAEMLTANTFRTYRRNLEHAGLGDRAAELTRQAVEIARDAAEGRAWVVGSQPPLEDCYSPELTPNDKTLRIEHGEMSTNLAAARVDGILVETHHTIREAVAATAAAMQTGLPVLVSFVCGSDGRLLSGETLTAAATAVFPFSPAALMVNCVPADTADAQLKELRAAAPETPLGAYANIGRADPVHGWVNTDAQDPECYAEFARQWLETGAGLIGGCCGTTPGHVARLRMLLQTK